jgi:hypothetical protein
MNKWFLVFFTMLVLGFKPLMAEETATPPATAASETKSSLTAEIKIGTSLENRDVVGEADSFPPETAQLVGWTRITGAKEPTQIKHVWKFNGAEMGTVSLNVTSSPFRTYSRKTVVGSGTYTLEVQDADGKVISSKEVQVKEAAK